MRTLISLALATSLLASSAFAADTASPLTAGKPAGVHQAQMEMGTTAWALIGIGVLAAVAIGVASSSNGSPLQPTTPLAVTTTTV
jgi:hypothetical protein